MISKTMTKLGTAALLAGCLTVPFGAAQAQTAQSPFSWLESVFAPDAAKPAVAPVQRVRRTAEARPVAPRVVGTSEPRLQEVSSGSVEVPGCFWCGRRIHISGLSF